MTTAGPPFATLSGVPVTGLHLVVPAVGIWHADVTLATAIDVPGPQTLLLSGSTWIGSVTRAVDFSGQRQVRLVGGQGGWRKPVPALEYQSNVGVPTQTVLADAAAFVQEVPPVIDASVPFSVGNYWVRSAGAASLVLWELLRLDFLSQWWMDPTGVVQTMPRPSTPILSDFVVEDVVGSTGAYLIATESPGDWLPGRTFSGPTASGSISRVEHRIARGKFWSEVMVP